MAEPCAATNGAYCCELAAGHQGNHESLGVEWSGGPLDVLMRLTAIENLLADYGPAIRHMAQVAALSAEHHESELAKARATIERLKDCHVGPGTTTPACGGCMTCWARVCDELQKQLDAEKAEHLAALGTIKRQRELLERALFNIHAPEGEQSAQLYKDLEAELGGEGPADG